VTLVVTDIEEMGWMQKEKRSFQAIPNWRNLAPDIPQRSGKDLE
jgi:hypothetical protein